jgi:hypothetical protein
VLRGNKRIVVLKVFKREEGVFTSSLFIYFRFLNLIKTLKIRGFNHSVLTL